MNNFKTPFVVDHGHLVLQQGTKNLLVDTGTPISFGYENNLEFFGAVYPVQNIEIHNPNRGGLLENHIDCVLGNDILRHFNILFEQSKNHAVFDTENDFSFDRQICVELQSVALLGVCYVFNAESNGKNLKFIFDTGAVTPFIKSDLIAGNPVVGHNRDYNPELGEFEFNLFSLDLQIANKPFTINFGTLPQFAELQFVMTATDGVAGYDLYKTNDFALNLKTLQININI
jgi:hypothetical protein